MSRIFRVKLADCERAVNFSTEQAKLKREQEEPWMMGSFVRELADDGHERSCLTSETKTKTKTGEAPASGTCNEICLRSAALPPPPAAPPPGRHTILICLTFLELIWGHEWGGVGAVAYAACLGSQGSGRTRRHNKHMKSLLRILFVCAAR